jgi:4-diphosphocytidyl-2-C-methyl-D-erythritol kinase
MQEVRLKAPAKINLTLNIISKRLDGYHNISSIMQTVSLYDDVLIRKSKLPGIKIFTNLPNLPRDRNNLVFKLVENLINEYNIQSGVLVKLFKRIPMSAGLGGGSSDCAAALLGMIKLFKLPITTYAAYNICKKYGADVPFCYMGGTVLAESTGANLKRLPEHPSTLVLIALQNFYLSTRKIYDLFDKNFSVNYKKNYKIKNEKLITGIKIKNKKKIAHNFHNDLEKVSTSLCPQINKIKKIMLDNGALGSSMTGSGPSVFGYYEDFSTAQAAVKILKNNFPLISTFLVHTC